MLNLIRSGNKKGGLTDMFIWMTMGFAMVLFMVVMVFVANTSYSKLGEVAHLVDANNGSAIVNDTIGAVVNSYASLRWVSVMLILGMALSILLTSFLVRTNPIFFVPYVFLLVIAVIVSVPISNTYEVIYTNPVLSSSLVGFFGATWIFLHLPIWVTSIGLLSGILMFINVLRSDY